LGNPHAAATNNKTTVMMRVTPAGRFISPHPLTLNVPNPRNYEHATRHDTRMTSALLRTAGLLVLAGVFCAMSNGLYPVPFATAFALGVAAAVVRGARSMLCGLAAVVPVLYAGGVLGYWRFAPTTALTFLSIALVAAAVFVPPLCLDRLAHDVRLPCAAFVLPIVVTCFAHGFMHAWPYGALGMLFTETAYWRELAQSMALFGLPGIFFLSGLVASAIAGVLEEGDGHRRGKSRHTRFAVGVLLLVIVLHFAGGFVIANDPSNGATNPPPRTRVGAVIMNWTNWEQNVHPRHGPRHPPEWVDMVVRETELAASEGAKIILWSEMAIQFETHKGDTLEAPCKSSLCEAIEKLRVVAKKYGSYIAASYVLDRFSAPKDSGGKLVASTNTISLIAPSGKILFEYDKAYPVYGTLDELHTPGPSIVPFADTEFGRIGAIVCADAGYPWMIAQAGRQHVDVLLVPSLDWGPLYRSITPSMLLRAIENGFVVFRACSQGMIALADQYGLPIHVDNYFAHHTPTFPCDNSHGRCHYPFHVIADAPLGKVARTTLYPWLFDVHAYVCYALTIAIVIASLIKGRANKKAKAM
jgi:apolipoprotein N-acyltransferase